MMHLNSKISRYIYKVVGLYYHYHLLIILTLRPLHQEG